MVGETLRKLAIAIPIGTLVLASFVANVTAEDDPEPPVLDRWIVGFYENPEVTVSSYAGEEVVQAIPELQMIVVKVANPALFLAQTQTDPNVRYVEWDNPAYAILDFTPNDTKYNDAGHYGSKLIQAQIAWDKTRGSTAIKVGMLDSGIYRTHEDFTGGRVLQGYDFYSNDNDPQDTSSCSYHGSHTSGTAGATINNGKGIAGLSQHKILPVRAFAGGFFGCSGSTTALVNGLKYIADQGSHISSNSWGSSSSSTAINDALTYAHNKGTIHVAAAGNSGGSISYPWRSNDGKAIIVTAVDSSKNIASFSSRGPQSDLAAPGVSILSVKGGSTTAYQTLSGTSMACPHVAGTAALVKALNPSMSFSSVESRLKSNAEDRGAAGEDDLYGAGLVRADRSVF